MERKLVVGIIALTLATWLATSPGAVGQSKSGAAAAADPAKELSLLKSRYRQRPLATPFPGLYQLDMGPERGPRTSSPILLTGDGQYAFNNGVRGARREDTLARLPEQEWGQLVMRWRDSFRTDDLIQFGDGPLRVIVLSAFDCPYSKRLEGNLAAAHVRYAVSPSVIGTANARFLPDLWCSANRASAWRTAISQGRLPPRAGAGCRYDAAYFETFSGLLGGSKPTLLFADGTLGYMQEAAPVQAKLAELAKRGIQF